jgi:hypothetical protein
MTIGHIKLHVVGKLTKGCFQGKDIWKFSGSATAYPDKFDFNQAYRAGVTSGKDLGMALLDFLQKNASKWFYMKPQGSTTLEDVGLCQKGKLNE